MMMTIKVAKHMNHLLSESKLVHALTVRGDGCVLYVGKSNHNSPVPADATEVHRQCVMAITDLLPAARHDTIARAATERKMAGVADIRDGYSWDQTPDVLLACERAQPVIRAILEESNRARTAVYEAYRLACEQGVAVPPQ